MIFGLRIEPTHTLMMRPAFLDPPCVAESAEALPDTKIKDDKAVSIIGPGPCQSYASSHILS